MQGNGGGREEKGRYVRIDVGQTMVERGVKKDEESQGG